MMLGLRCHRVGAGDVRYWHLADLRLSSLDVRYWGKSGHSEGEALWAISDSTSKSTGLNARSAHTLQT
jgi:hypothetical protein